ncbi:MAG TPA: hypothetical protein PLP23_16430 [Panacibacter sp.]|nr:hypothetical protein [Panacibacter sp.]
MKYIELERVSKLSLTQKNNSLMLIPLIKGTKEIIIGYEESYLKCPSCEVDTLHEIHIISKYFHVYGIPFCPTGKEAHTVCNKCGLRRYNIPLEKNFFPNYDNLKSRYKHPWYTYAIMTFGILIILLPIYFEILRAPDK